MQMNIMELIKDGKIGDSLRSRGGQRYRYNRYIFIKTNPNTVKAYEGWTYTTITKEMKDNVAKAVCTLKSDRIIFNLKKWGAKHPNERNWRNDHFDVGPMIGFLSLNFLFRCYGKWSHGQQLIETNNKGAVCPFSKMEFDWNGNLISKIPKYAQKKYDDWYDGVKKTRNAQARARYAQAAAEREFRKYDKAGKLDEYPIANIFTIQNAQLRSYAINAIGLEKVLAPYPTKVIDTETIPGQGKYELVDIEIPSVSIYQWGSKMQSQPKWCLYLKMINQSTGEYHLEGVPRRTDNTWNYIPAETVRGALAWRDGESSTNNYGSQADNSNWKYIKPVTLT